MPLLPGAQGTDPPPVRQHSQSFTHENFIFPCCLGSFFKGVIFNLVTPVKPLTTCDVYFFGAPLVFVWFSFEPTVGRIQLGACTLGPPIRGPPTTTSARRSRAHVVVFIIEM